MFQVVTFLSRVHVNALTSSLPPRQDKRTMKSAMKHFTNRHKQLRNLATKIAKVVYGKHQASWEDSSKRKADLLDEKRLRELAADTLEVRKYQPANLTITFTSI
jgi:hypothetical protein